LQDIVLTANNMIKKNWSCDYYCSLCLCMHETTEHLLVRCNFSEAVWNLVAAKFNMPCYIQLSHAAQPVDWFRRQLIGSSKKERKRRLGVLLTFWWWIWKEQNDRIFEVKEKSPQQLARQIKEEVSAQVVVYLPPDD
jgi:hypothetical protein